MFRARGREAQKCRSTSFALPQCGQILKYESTTEGQQPGGPGLGLRLKG